MNIVSSSQTAAFTSPSSKIATRSSHGYVLHNSSKKHIWVIDTGATDHMTYDPGQLTSHTPSSQLVVSNANGTPSPVIGEGSLSLSDSLTLDSVLIVPSLHHNLLSVAQITTALNCTVTFWPTHCVFQDILSSKMIGCGTKRGKLYYLDLASDSEASLSQAYKIGGISVEKQTSEVCQEPSCSFSLKFTKSLVPFSLVHSDVWGPAKITTPGGARWFVTFIDDCTRMTWVSFLQTKGEVSSKFQQFYQMVDTQFHTRIQVLRSDNGREFLNHDLNQFLQDHGIIHQCSFPYTPQHNGMAERKNRHLLEVVHASLIGANMPRSIWGEAVLSAAYLINRIPSSILNFQTPLQTLYHHLQIPPSKNLEPRIFGCVVFVHLHDHQRSKLDPRAEKCVFISCAPHQKGRPGGGSKCQDFSHFRIFPRLKTTGRRLKATGRHLQIRICFFKTTGRQRTATSRLPAVKFRRRIEEFLAGQEYSSAPVPHQSPAEDVIQVTSFPEIDNINEIAHDDLILEGTEPAYQFPKRKNRGKPPVHYKANLNAKGKYPINNYVSINRLSESRSCRFCHTYGAKWRHGSEVLLQICGGATMSIAGSWKEWLRAVAD
ncbi:hypothetical protein L3X38_033202 [Prunus dulcis]|uniref:Integrase catalytic domain-containing protein n=1 Tax=Prunus dulcis TaxID=3755 RepID=A0AAD4YWR3_PRUDU|nr:hypothetical protein L3X38_033202 [Prunus dulcis]